MLRALGDAKWAPIVASLAWVPGPHRAMAVLTLATLDAAPFEAVFLDALSDPDSDVRAYAAHGLTKHASAGALRTVRAVLATEDVPSVRVFLVDALDAHGALT